MDAAVVEAAYRTLSAYFPWSCNSTSTACMALGASLLADYSAEPCHRDQSDPLAFRLIGSENRLTETPWNVRTTANGYFIAGSATKSRHAQRVALDAPNLLAAVLQTECRQSPPELA